MNNEIKIPKGWRKLRRGERVRATDKYFIPSANDFRKAMYVSFTGDRVGDNFGDLDTQPWIRRRTTKKARK